MSRLTEVKREIEQLCKDIERDARRARHHRAPGDKVASAPPVHIHLVVSGDLSHVHVKVSLEQDESQKR
ncbi:hypothetical protein [Paraburkholderia silvatlantica]|uniref:hypothetical protein n=1 Tax=Paraburkholderia silvatlantica TaxID=321895 RepID=UPI003750E793